MVFGKYQSPSVDCCERILLSPLQNFLFSLCFLIKYMMCLSIRLRNSALLFQTIKSFRISWILFPKLCNGGRKWEETSKIVLWAPHVHLACPSSLALIQTWGVMNLKFHGFLYSSFTIKLKYLWLCVYMCVFPATRWTNLESPVCFWLSRSIMFYIPS